MDKGVLSAVATAGALAAGYWYLTRTQETDDSKAISELQKKAEELSGEVEGLTKVMKELRDANAEVRESDEQLNRLADKLAKDVKNYRAVPLKIGTRDSELAMWQAHHVERVLKESYRDIETKIVGMKTLGDKDLKSALSQFSNKGVFTKELDAALLLGEVDIAVHSMKDLPTVLESGLHLACVLERGTVEDAVVMSSKHEGKGYKTLDDLPASAVIGTSALRRRATISRQYPGFVIKDVRGNLQTRLRKLDSTATSPGYDALILARTGLQRCGLEGRISQVLDSQTFGHAVSQGALAVVCREADRRSREILRPLNHLPTLFRVSAERALLRNLEGGCKVPIAVTSAFDAKTGSLTLKGWVVSLNGKKSVDAEQTKNIAHSDMQQGLNMADALGVEVGEMLRKNGAEVILAACRLGKNLSFAPPSTKK